MKTIYGKIKTITIVLLLATAAGLVGYMTSKSFATVTTQNEQIVTNPDLKLYSYVYIQIWSIDGGYVYDTTAESSTGGWTARASYTYANTDIEVAVDSASYTGQMAVPKNIRSKRIAVRLMGSADATPDKDDVQISAFLMFYGPNGWDKWPGPSLEY